jgi:hypothetical protein
LLAACLEPVYAPIDPSMALEPGWVALRTGDSTRFTLTSIAGDTIPASAVSWTSSAPWVVHVSSAGVVRGRARGEATIRGSGEGRTALATVVVTDPVLVGAADIAVCAGDADGETAALLDRIPGVVFAAGDNAYQDGTPFEYLNCYGPTWGRHRARTRPAPGNHEYHTSGATGYYGYFGVNAGDPTKGYYSYPLGAWHVVVLNTNVPFEAGSPQAAWLADDLAHHPARCTVAYWHHPRFSSGREGSDPRLSDIWQILQSAGVEVAIVGHDHHYERFAPQRADGTSDSLGVREFVVGTGGGDLFPMGTVAPNSESRIQGRYGVLKLTLSSDRYGWEFIRAPGAQVLDSGTTACH